MKVYIVIDTDLNAEDCVIGIYSNAKDANYVVDNYDESLVITTRELK